jgi:hypothetical protein
MAVGGKYTKSDLELLLRSDEISTVTDALLYITFSSEDIEWVQDQCLALLDHENDEVSGLAATCLGHVARLHRTINKSKVLPVLQNKLKDPRLSGRVQDALADIQRFAKDEPG